MTTAADFTLAAYRKLIERTRAMYPFAGFEVLEQSAFAGRFCILRHDIDVSPTSALEVARIEADLGVQATYTVLLTGPHYNAFEAEVREQLRQISSLGHALALHLDATWHSIASEAELEKAVEQERKILEHLIGVRVKAFSFHNTTEFTLSCRADSYGGLWNAYAGRLQDELSYVSDSNGYWRFRTWDELLDEDASFVQVLTHPEWWTDEPLGPAEKVCRELDARERRVWDSYRAGLAAFGRELRSDVPRPMSVFSAYKSCEIDHALRLWLSGHRAAGLLELHRAIQRAGFPNSGEGSEWHQTLNELASGQIDQSDPRLAAVLSDMADEFAKHHT